MSRDITVTLISTWSWKWGVGHTAGPCGYYKRGRNSGCTSILKYIPIPFSSNSTLGLSLSVPLCLNPHGFNLPLINRSSHWLYTVFHFLGNRYIVRSLKGLIGSVMVKQSSRFGRVCVFCGSSPGNRPSYQLAALQLAKQLVRYNHQPFPP